MTTSVTVETFDDPRSSLPNQYDNVTAREIDFVSRFGSNWDALRKILGIMRPIRKAPGTRLVSYTASVTLESGEVPEGAVIPYSKYSLTEVAHDDVTIEKYAKAVPIEDVNKYGVENAIEKSDDEFLNSLQNVVLTRFYSFLNGGGNLEQADSSHLTANVGTWQQALAKAKGLVLNEFQKMRKTVTNVVGFANIMDLYDYLGDKEITTQTAFGLTYIQNFMGYSTLFLLSEADIAPGTVIAVPVENINLYYVDPGDSGFAKLGLNYTTQGETNLIGFHANGNYSTAVGESFAIMGMTLWAEYVNGIAIVTVGAGGAGGEGGDDSGDGDDSGETA